MVQKPWTEETDQHAALSFDSDASDRLSKLRGQLTAPHVGSWLTGTPVGRMARWSSLAALLDGVWSPCVCVETTGSVGPSARKFK